MATQSADLFKNLYNAQMGTIVGDPPMSADTAHQKRAGAYTGAVADYERLMGGGGGTGVSSGTTLRQASEPRPIMPTSSYAAKIPIGEGIGKGTTPGTIPGTMDDARIEALGQRFAAPGIRQLRSSIQDVQHGYYENPNVKRMTLRDSLAGYGQGLESVMAGAIKEGTAVAGTEFRAKQTAALQAERIRSSEAMQASAIASNEKLAQYNNEWRAYLSTLS